MDTLDEIVEELCRRRRVLLSGMERRKTHSPEAKDVSSSVHSFFPTYSKGVLNISPYLIYKQSLHLPET